MMLQSESVAISRYGGEPGGGSGELNAVEAAADRRTKMKQQIENMKRDQAEIERVLRKRPDGKCLYPTPERSILKNLLKECPKCKRDIRLQMKPAKRYLRPILEKDILTIPRKNYLKLISLYMFVMQ